MSNQILISSGAKLRDLDDVIIGTDGILSSLGFDVPYGVPRLDANGKILASELPNSVMEFKGVWNAATNTPYLVDGVGNAGDVYLCNVAGTVDFGAGPITFAVGDYAVYTGSVWARSSGAVGTVTSVAVSRSGDALAITGSPITTSGTINIGFTGNSSQYINGAGNLVTFPTIISEAQNLVTEVYNETGATLTKGTVVYINGGHGNLPTVTKAIATSDATSAQTYGVIRADITNNNNGYVTVIGSLNDLDTQAYPDGTQLYLSGTTAGAWTSTKPSAPIHLVYVGIVVRSHPTQGVVEVRIQNGYELNEIHDVQIIDVANNDGIFYDSATSLWKNKTIAEVLGYTPANAATTLTINGTTYDLSANRTWNVGTVTSVGLSAPTGFSVTGSPVTSSGTLALSFAAGYSLPTTAKQSNWDDAYTWVAAFPTQTGNAGKFLTTDGSTLSWATNPLGTVTSVAMSVPTGLSVSGSPITTSGTLAVTFAAGYSIPTNASQTNWDTAYTNRITSATSPLSITSNVISISQANTTTNGYLSSTDWNTFNGKQNAITLTTTGTSGAATLVGSTLNIPQYQSVLTNPVTGTGVSGQVAYFNGTSSINSNSTFLYDGDKVGIGITPIYKLHVYAQDNTTTTAANIRGQYYGPSMGTDSILSTYYALNVYNGSSTSLLVVMADGKIGINGPANSYTLYVHGTGLYEGDVQINATSPQFITNAPTGATFAGGLSTRINGVEKARFAWNDNKGIYIFDAANAGLSYLNSTDATKFRVNSTGNAIFGGSNPLSGGSSARWLTIDADNTSAYSGGVVYAIDNVAKGYTYFQSDYLLIQAQSTFGIKLRSNASTDALTVLSSGSIGVNNNSPLTKFHINGTSASSYTGNGPGGFLRVSNGSDASWISADFNGSFAYFGSTGPSEVKFAGYNYGTGNNIDMILNQNTMVLKANQNVYVNTTSGVSGGGALQVNGDVNINGNFKINGTIIGGGGGSGVTGSGSLGYVARWTGSSTLANSVIYDNGTNVSFASNGPRALLDLGYKNDSSTASYVMFGGVNGPADNTGTGYGGGIVFKFYDTGGGYTKRSAGILQTAEGNYIRAGLAFFYNGSANQTTDWVEGFRLNDSGQVLVNAINSAYGASAGYMLGMRGSSTQGFISIARAGQTLDSQGVIVGLDTSTAYVYVRDNIGLTFGTNDTFRAKFQNNGNFSVGNSADNGYKMQVYGNMYISTDLYVAGSAVYAGGVSYSGVQTFNNLVYLNSTTTIAVYQTLIWKGSTSASDFSMGNGGAGMYILSSAAIDLNAPIVQRNGVGYSFAGTSSSYNVLLLNSGTSIDEITILGGIKLSTTTAGLVPPRMTTTQLNALSSRGSTYCPNGTTVFDTTINILRTWNGTAWMNLW